MSVIQAVSYTHLDVYKRQGYQVLNVNESSYFAVRGNISPNAWQYICLVPYEEMEKTIYATQILVAVLPVSYTHLLFLPLPQQGTVHTAFQNRDVYKRQGL